MMLREYRNFPSVDAIDFLIEARENKEWRKTRQENEKHFLNLEYEPLNNEINLQALIDEYEMWQGRE